MAVRPTVVLCDGSPVAFAVDGATGETVQGVLEVGADGVVVFKRLQDVDGVWHRTHAEGPETWSFDRS